MDTLDGYLSRRLQRASPGALVYRDAQGAYRAERPGLPPLGLGDSPSDARLAVDALVRQAIDVSRD